MANFDLTIDGPTLPSAQEDFYSIPPNTTIIFNVLTNDFLGQQPTSLSLDVLPAEGTATVINGDSIEYVCNPGYTGEDSLYYKITDTNLDFSVAKVNITIG